MLARMASRSKVRYMFVSTYRRGFTHKPPKACIQKRTRGQLCPGQDQRVSVHMCVQELQTPELQPLSMESKAALALLKYLPLNPQVIPQVTPHSHRHRFRQLPYSVAFRLPFHRLTKSGQI